MVKSQPISPWEGQENVDYDAVGTPKNVPWYAHPTTYEVMVVLLLAALMVWWW